MSKFRKKPVVIEAVEFRAGEQPSELAGDVIAGRIRYVEDGTMLIDTLEGSMIARPGDWIIRGVKGELYPCKPDIFAATYERTNWETPAGERDDAIVLANKVLERPWADPDDDLAVLARQFLRALEPKWQPIETAPHEVEVLLFSPATQFRRAKMEVGFASAGWRRGGYSTMHQHGSATHWQPLPDPPASP